MPPLILHHYPRSPFAEKARCLLGCKGLPWTSVIVPAILPKPDVVALTGGYRRTPFLQIGADIYCDTALIADLLERLAPTPTLYPLAIASSARIQAQWADSVLFWNAITYCFQPAGLAHLFAGAPPEHIEIFRKDRAALRASAQRIGLGEATHALLHYLGLLEAQLGDGREWLLRAQLSIADFSVYHPLWYVSRAGSISTILDGYPRLQTWMQRIAAIGHGTPEKLDSEAAIAIARESTPQAVAERSVVALDGFEPGDRVSIAPSDYGIDPVEGELIAAYANEFLLRRHDSRAGEVVLHFPRIGYHIKPIQQSASA